MPSTIYTYVKMFPLGFEGNFTYYFGEDSNWRKTLENAYRGPSTVIRSLIELGTLGHYPLFNEEWLEEAINNKNNLGKKDKLKAKEIFKNLEKHRTVERQKAYIMELVDEERLIFVRFFVKIVEGKIVDKRPQLQ